MGSEMCIRDRPQAMRYNVLTPHKPPSRVTPVLETFFVAAGECQTAQILSTGLGSHREAWSTRGRKVARRFGQEIVLGQGFLTTVQLPPRDEP